MIAASSRVTAGQRILVVGPSWVGDMVMTHSVIQVLASQHPGCEIDVLAPPWSLPLVARMPGVREAIALPVRRGKLDLRVRRTVGQALRERNYDHAIILPRTFKSALVPWMARIPRRTGYRGEMRFGLINDMRWLDEGLLPQYVQRCVALAPDSAGPLPPPVPHPRLTVDPVNTERVLSSLGLTTTTPVVAMMPGAEYGPSKRWPPAYYAQLALRLAADGYQVWVLGSPRDRAEADEVEASARGSVRNLCGRTQLVDAIDLIAQARLAVANDSGLMHIAAAVGCPVVALYGSTAPRYAPPLTDQASVLYLGLDCSPCFARECPLSHLRCLKDLTPDRVYAAAREQLAGSQ